MIKKNNPPCARLNFRSTTLSLSLLSALLSHSVSATESTSLITEEDLVTDLLLVNGAARMAQAVSKAPSSVTIIDRDMIDASGAQNWTDLFRLVPGFQSYAINGNRYGIDHHGLGREFPNHLEVMVDGRSVYEPLFSSVEWNSLGLHLDDIAYIEIVRGPSAPSYGSNAFLGAINIVTRKPIQDRGIAIRTTYGSRDTQNVSTRFNHSWGDLDYRVSLGYRNNNGFPAVADGPMDDGQEMFQSEFRGTYTPNAIDTLDIHLGYNHDKLGFGDPDHPDEYAPTEFDNQYQSVKWHRTLNNGNEVQMHLYHNRFDGENRVSLGMLSELLAAELEVDLVTAQGILGGLGVSDGPFDVGFRDVKSERYDLELKHLLTLSNQSRLAWGVGVRDEMIDAEALLEPEESADQMSFRLFGNLEWQPAKEWVINAGLMVEHNSIVDTIASPRLAVNYLLNPNHSFRISAARGNRSPSLLEANEFHVDQRDGLLLSAIRRAADDISEEKLDNIELGYVASFPDHGLTFDLRAYREKIRDGLQQYQAPVTYSPSFDDRIAVRDNIFTSTTKGVELQLRYQPTAATLIAAQYTHANLDGEFPGRFEPELVVISLDNNLPQNSASILVSQDLTDRFSISATASYQDEVVWKDSGDQLDSFTRFDAQLSYQLPFGGDRATLSMVVQNLGASYPDFHNNNQFNSRYYLQLELELP